MIGSFRLRPSAAWIKSVTVSGGVSLCLAIGGPVDAQTISATVDVSATTGGSSNPFLLPGSNTSSGYAALLIAPQAVMATDRGSIKLDGHYNLTDYFRFYSRSEAYSASIRAEQALSERLKVHASFEFNSSIIGQNDFSPASATAPADPTIVPIVGNSDVSLFGQRTRQTSIQSSAGFEWRRTALDTISLDAFAQHIAYGSQLLTGSRGAGTTLRYSRAISAVTQIGVQMSGEWDNFQRQGSSGSIYQPQLTVSTKVNEQWSLTAAAGLLIATSRLSGETDRSVGFSGDFYACRQGERGRLCLRAYRDAQATGLGDISRRVGASVDYTRRLSERDFLQANLGYTKLQETGLVVQPAANSYGEANLSLERRFSRRLAAGTAFAYRNSFGDALNRPSDYNVSLYLRTRLGKIR